MPRVNTSCQRLPSFPGSKPGGWEALYQSHSKFFISRSPCCFWPYLAQESSEKMNDKQNTKQVKVIKANLKGLSQLKGCCPRPMLAGSPDMLIKPQLQKNLRPIFSTAERHPRADVKPRSQSRTLRTVAVHFSFERKLSILAPQTSWVSESYLLSLVMLPRSRHHLQLSNSGGTWNHQLLLKSQHKIWVHEQTSAVFSCFIRQAIPSRLNCRKLAPNRVASVSSVYVRQCAQNLCNQNYGRNDVKVREKLGTYKMRFALFSHYFPFVFI